MKNIIIAIITSLLLFAASAGTSLYLNQPPEIVEPTEEEQLKTIDVPLDDPFPEPAIKEQAAQMPVGNRPDQALTIEAVRAMADSAEQRHRQLDEREKELQKEENRVQILFDDLRREKTELTSFSEGVQSKIDALDRMTVELQQLIAKVENQKKELRDLEKQTGIETDRTSQIVEKVNLIKSWFVGMEPAQAAAVLKEKADQGELEFAAELLHSLEGRQQSKILTAMHQSDPALVTQLLGAIKVKNKGKK